MDEMYGHDYSDYSMLPENSTPASDYEAFSIDIPAAAFRDKIPTFRSELFPAASSGASIQRSSTATARAARGSPEEEISRSAIIRAKIASHPLYAKLLQAYIDCHKVGAPPEVVNLLDETLREKDLICRRSAVSSCSNDDPELDLFMETYCDVLVKYKTDLARPFDEATTFLNKMESQLTDLCYGYVSGGDAWSLSSVKILMRVDSYIKSVLRLKKRLQKRSLYPGKELWKWLCTVSNAESKT